jgi:hypothetical protein
MASDSDTEPEIPSDDEIAIILNVHMPAEGVPMGYDGESMGGRHATVDQFRPTNPIWLQSLRFVPSTNDDDSEPRPWRDAPSTRPEYFNYGFTELVWDAYKFKQYELRRMFADKERVGVRRRNEHLNKKN